MPHITLDDEQARIVSEAQGDVEVRDSAGRCLGFLTHGFSPEEIAEGKRRAASNGPWRTTTEVLEHLAWHGFSEEDIQEALRRANSDEPRYTTAQVLEHLRSLEQA